MLGNASSAATAVEHAITLGVLGLGVALAGWYLATGLTLVACAASRGLGRRWDNGEAAVRAWGAPVLRRSVSAAAGLALGAGLGLAHASETSPPTLPVDLGWRPASEAEPLGANPAAVEPPVAPTTRPPTNAPEPSRPVLPGTRVVQAGDSLWSIAAADLAERGLMPSDLAVAALWPRWYAANRAVVGPDPHLIYPGQKLQPPTEGAPR